MKKINLFISSLFCLGIIEANAQFTTLLNFNGTNGANPTGNLTLSVNGKVLYGLTSDGGVNGNGNVFSVNTDGSGYKDLLDFSGANGTYPYGSLTLLNNKLYGMTANGGANDSGCIFSIDTNGFAYKDMLDFTGANGSTPFGSLTISGNKFYGMTFGGGANLFGCIFCIDTNGGGYRDLQDFNSTNGANPYWYLTPSLSGKMLYGMTANGGVNGYGNIIVIDTDGTGFRDLFDFDGTNGAYPSGSLTVIRNKLYGMTANGGAMDSGCVFSVDSSGLVYTDILDFNATNGSVPFGSLALSGKTLFGMTTDGGLNGDGNVFEIDTTGNKYRDLLDFNITNGEYPEADLTLSGNVLYGMTYEGGTDSFGVIFKTDTSSVASINEIKQASTDIKLFPNPSNGVFTIQSTVVSGQSIVEVYNMLGEKMYSKQWTSNNGLPIAKGMTIDLSDKASGVYLYRVLTETGELIGEGKFVIE
jgi:uncharacterized repeat protein (TIGR03803 family)